VVGLEAASARGRSGPYPVLAGGQGASLGRRILSINRGGGGLLGAHAREGGKNYQEVLAHLSRGGLRGRGADAEGLGTAQLDHAAVVYSRAQVGIEAPLVTIEVHLSNSVPFALRLPPCERAFPHPPDHPLTGRPVRRNRIRLKKGVKSPPLDTLDGTSSYRSVLVIFHRTLRG
jgi:hypothetical protein